MRKRESLRPPDSGILAAVIGLVIAGVILVYDASYAKMADAEWANYDIYYMAKRQLVYAVMGLGIMMLASRVSLKTLLKWTVPLLVVSIALLVAVMVPGVGYRVNGAVRWLKLGPISVQPSEIAKTALVLYLAGIFSQRKMLVRRLSRWWVAPASIVALVAGLVFLEPDLGTTIAIVGTCFVLFYAAGAMKRHLFGIGAAGCLLVVVAILAAPYRMERINTWMNPWKDPYGEGYQVIHSLIALGTGGLSGIGLCEGREKLYLPAASTDFILATLGEELGLLGCVALLGGYLFLTYRGLEVARKCKSTYANLLAVGFTSMIGFQALINVSVVSAAIPATGVPLPFISYGGSSLILSMAAVGVLLGISRQADVELEERELYESNLDGWRDGRSHISRNQHRRSSTKSRTRRRVALRR